MKPLATWSACRAYRYTLRRPYLQDLFDSREKYRVCAFLLLNPSTATETEDDPTIRRCIGFARRWGFAELVIINVYALRSTDPAGLWKVDDPVGPGNDAAIAEVAARAERIVCGWGKHARTERIERVAELLAGRDTYALAVNQDGSPKHPLYIPAATEPQPYTLPGAVALAG